MSILCSSNRQHGDLGDVQDGADLELLAQGVNPNLGLQGSIRSKPFTAISSILIRVAMYTLYRSPNNHPAPVYTS
jgi:hypothetical protein